MGTQISKDMGKKEFIALMAMMSAIVALSIDAMLPALDVIGRDLKIENPNHAQFIVASIFAGMALGQIFFGPLSDTLGRKKILYMGLSLYLVGTIVCLLSSSLTMILIGRVIQGFGVAGPQNSYVSIVRDKFSGRSMARIMSLVMMVFMTVPILAPTIGQGLLLLGSWHLIFGLYMLYALVIFVWIYFRLEEPLAVENRVPYNLKNINKNISEVFKNRSTVFYIFAISGVFGALIGHLSSSQQIFQGQYNVGKMFVIYFGLQAMGIAAASFLNSRLVERLGMHNICVRTLSALIITSCIFLVINLVISPPFWMFFVFAGIMLFSLGLLFGNLNALAMEPLGHIAGMASAVINSSSSLIAIVLGGLIGQLYNGTLLPIVAGYFVLMSLALTCVLLAQRDRLKTN